MARLIQKKLHKHFWNEEKGLSSMFILLCISNFIIIPFFTQRLTIMILMRLTWFALLVAGISSLSENKSQIRVFSVIPVLFIIVSGLDLFLGGRTLDYLDFIMQLAVFGLLIGMVLIKVFEDGSITIHRVIGSILAYMLIGNVWSIAYHFFYVYVPGSLQISGNYANSGVPSSVFLYFSYTTLTTTGYGEILPVHAITRTLVIIEQLIGVLYPVVLIGRLVSLVTGTKEKSSGGS
jgi:hypothetical protein